MKRILFSLSLFLASVLANAENPCVQTCFTTDPAPMVHDGRLYVYTGHDEDKAAFFEMYEWRVYSTVDMVNWTDHGSPLSLEDFSWADDRAWAPQCIERDGKFYLYVPVHSKLTGAMAIGVGVSDSPTGPFKDAIGKPLVDGNWAYIDPTVFIDDDGQAYLYWGNPDVYYVKLNEDMLSYSGKVEKLKQTPESFGTPPNDSDSKSSYTEGPWFYKRNGIYYLVYAAGGIPEHIAYSTSDTPTGPWTYRGVIMPTIGSLNSFTNHAGVVDFMGNSYFFYHSGNLPGGGGFDRSICVEQFEYNADGTIPSIKATKTGPQPVAALNPYERVEAETIAWSEGVGTSQDEEVGVYVDKVHNGDYIKVSNVDFSDKGAAAFGASVAGKMKGSQIKVFLDSKDGELVAKADVPLTKDADTWEYFETPTLKEITGVHDVYFVFSGGVKNKALFNFDYWTFKANETSVDLIDSQTCKSVVVYNLLGVKVIETDDMAKLSSLPKGIYIINGRKVRI